jgi:hypothetical protein
MKLNRTFVVLAALALIVCLAAPALADQPKKGKKHQDQEDDDPWANHFGVSIGGGGVSSSAGFGFEGRLGLTYYVNKWLQLTLSPGFGTYPLDYEYSVIKNNQEETKTDTYYVKYVPVDLSVIFTPIRFSTWGIYMGPGVGMTYYWWTQKERDPDKPSQTVEKDFDETFYSTFVTAGVSFKLGGPFVANVGATYTIPDVTEFSTENGVLSFGFGGGAVF